MKKSRSTKKLDVSESVLETEKVDSTPALVPKLRFPEFRKEPGWPQHELREIAVILKGKGISKADIDPKGALPCIRYGELYTRYGETIRDAVSRTNVPSAELFFSKPHDVIIPSSGETKIDIAKASCVLIGDIALGGDLNVIRSTLNGTFLSYYLNGPKKIDIAKVAQGDTVVHLYPHQLEILRIAVPASTEQRKIASCLSSLDELIGEQGRKVDALRTHKKGLMQQLFPREGETQPQLRFPEFQDEDHWKYITLGDIAEIKLGKMLDKQKNKAGHLLPYLNNISVRWNEVNTTDLPQMYFDDTELDRFGLMAGDVVVCEGGEPGRAAVWDGRLPNVKFQKAIHRVRFTVPFEPKLFVLHLENLAGTNQFEMLFTGGGIKHLTRETFSQLRVPLISIREQQRIASCLSSLDDLITAETQKLEALKTHKRGLMQQMFPSPEEAS
jgi:type I restriction enzyme S subunit